MDLSLLNKLTHRNEDHQSLQLCCFQERYGDGVVAFLAWDEEIIESIVNSFTGGDSCYETVSRYFRDAEWYPLVYANDLSDALHKLTSNLETTLEGVTDLRLFSRAVERAGCAFCHNSNSQPLLSDMVKYMQDW